MQIKKTSSKKNILPTNIRNVTLGQIGFILVILFMGFIAGSWFLDKSYIVYYFTKVKNMVSSEAQDIQNTESYLQESNNLDTLTLDIPFDSLQQLSVKREAAIAKGVLLSSDDDLVNAKATVNQDNTVKIDLRLKGDWVDHIESPKWSYRIHVKGNDQLLGMTNFSIQAPETRQFLYEWAYHQNLIMENVLTTRFSFVNVIQNGEKKGIYAVEDNFTTELMESQGARAGVILRFDEDSLWINRANYIEDSFDTYTAAEQEGLFMVSGMDQASVQIFQSNSVTSDPGLNEEAQTAIALLRGFQDGSLHADQVFDLEKFGKFLAISDFWGGNHATYWHNLRFYYNPVTSLLEPVAYDGDTAHYQTNELARVFTTEAYFQDPQIRRAYAEQLEKILTPEYIEQLEASIDPQMQNYYAALLEEYGPDLVSSPWSYLESRRVMMADQINPPFPVQGRFAIKQTESGYQLHISLQNLMVLPVKMIGVEYEVGDQLTTLNVDQFTVSGDVLTDQSVPEITFIGDKKADTTPEADLIGKIGDSDGQALQNSDSPVVRAIVQISGLSHIYKIDLMPDYIDQQITNRPEALFAAANDVLEKYPFLVQQDEQTIIVKQGDWTVNGDLVIPPQYQLWIMPGTTLRFEENAILLLGNKLISRGTDAQPILLTAAAEHWAGLVVLNSSEQSTLEYTHIEKTASINRDGWILTGGVTFYKSPVHLLYTTLSDHAGEDAINIIHTTYEMQGVSISNSFADALDTDFSDGVIQDCTFYNIGGDAIDVSGSQTTVIDSKMTFITDKAISAGEKSTVKVDNIMVNTANIGIASKDLSVVTAIDVNLHDVAYAGFAAYIKKPVYGPGSITATGVVTTNVETLALVQEGNVVILDGQQMPTVSLDVKTLYELGILGN